MSKRKPVKAAPDPLTTDDPSDAAPPDPRAEVPVPVARLERLRHRLENAAYDFPGVDAVVVFRPDLRRDEAERQARNFRSHPHEAARYAGQLVEWIPPSNKRINELGGQMYWDHIDIDNMDPGLCRAPAFREFWRCTLFGPPGRDVDNTALRLFNMLARDAARDILGGKGRGDTPRSGWLIHLADQDEPLGPGSQRRWLHWPRLGGVHCSPTWVPFCGVNPEPCWWAARLFNVFQLSGAAIAQAIDLAARAPAPAAPAPSPQ
ncbi:MAG TPA: hypothetical protein VG013_28800, partial [Gemmataceae bacterium]|nr:hypothetical protein [Gemmataceae bacterium]